MEKWHADSGCILPEVFYMTKLVSIYRDSDSRGNYRFVHLDGQFSCVVVKCNKCDQTAHGMSEEDAPNLLNDHQCPPTEVDIFNKWCLDHVIKLKQYI